MKLFLCIISCLLITVLNQNCGELSSFSKNNRELASLHKLTMLDIDLPSSKPRVGDRTFLSTVFADVFLPQRGSPLNQADAISKTGKKGEKFTDFITSDFNAEDKKITNIIIKNILEQNIEFHGPCSFIDRDPCVTSRFAAANRATQAELSNITGVSVTREGYRISTCKEIIEIDRAIENVISNVSNRRDSVFKEKYIMDIYDLFYPSQKIDEDAYYALVESYEAVKTRGNENLDVWRSVVIPICYSIGWQIP